MTSEETEKLREIARGNIERHLGDVVDLEANEDSHDSIYDEAYTLAFDALADAGVDHATARQLADEEARKIAQP